MKRGIQATGPFSAVHAFGRVLRAACARIESALIACLVLATAPAWAQLGLGDRLSAVRPAEDAPDVRLVPAFTVIDPAASPGAGVVTRIPDERFVPMILEIGPGSVGGVAVIEVPQDATQRARVLAPFAATPGRPSEWPVVLPISNNASGFRVGLVEKRGSTTRVLRMDALADFPDGNEQPLDFEVDHAIRLIATIGDTSIPAAISGWEQGLGDPPMGSFAAATFTPARVPAVSMGFDAFDVLVVRSSAINELLPRQIGAIRGWVQSGGRLVVIADAPGEDWARWFAPGEAPISVAPPTRDPPDAGVAFGTARLRPSDVGSWRPMTLTQIGARDRWTLLPAGASSSQPALAASGPVGFGWVCLLGFEPGSALGRGQTETIAAIWSDLLGPGLFSRIDTGHPDEPGSSRRRWFRPSSGASDSERDAVIVAAENAIEVPELGNTVFYAIAGAVLLLAALVGPIDAVVLKKLRLRHRSWLTAIAWTALATYAAWMMPRIVRTGDTQIGRVRTLDLFVAGRPGEPDASVGFTSGVAAVFAGTPMTAELQGLESDRWWRGVAPIGGRRNETLSPVTLAATGGGLEPAEPIGQGLWTIRTLLERGPATSPLHARVTSLAGGSELAVTLTGLEPGDAVRSAVLRTGTEEGFVLDLTEWAGTGLRAIAVGEPARVDLPDRTADTLGDLPGAFERRDTIGRYLAGGSGSAGEWVVIELVIERASPAVSLSRDAVGRELVLARMLTLIEDSGSATRD